LLPPTLWPTAARTLARTFGAHGIALRSAHKLRRATNAFRAAPRHDVTLSPQSELHPFAVDAAALAASTDRSSAIERAERVVAGEFLAFGSQWRVLPASLDGWHGTGNAAAFPRDARWWKISHAGAHGTDVKDVWEPARFAWVYDLVRGYLLTRDDRYADAFHRYFAEWLESSPPFLGVHWSCGQETTIRAVALLYAEANLASAPSSDSETLARIASVLAASGERIADAIGRAISQRNNHAISEAVGMLVLGTRFRGSHPEAAGWAREGRRLLESLIVKQFAEDGWYIQHSFAYLRLALDQCIIAQRMLRSSHASLSEVAIARLRAAVDLLLAVVDPATGVVPNHGHNDGALVHPISLADYRDFRPVITAACASFGHPLPRDIPASAEALAWLGLPAPERGEPQRDGVIRGSSGWVAARTGGGAVSVFLRAGSYTSRPAHIDPLHIDVRFGSDEVIADPGTFSYNAPPPWRNSLALGAVHNGPLLDDEEPGIRRGPFLWYVWPSARVVSAEMDGDEAVIVAEVPDRVRRTVRVMADRVVVRDEILARDARTVRIRWLLHPEANPASVRVEGGSRVVEAREGEPPGWFSPSYGERVASRYVEVEREAGMGEVVLTEIRNTAS
jgi:hypothetical protein